VVKRILSIDGGATQVGFAASFLSTIEDTERLRIADYFDVIAGIGGGGVLAIALGQDVPARTLVGWGVLDTEADGSDDLGQARWREFCRIRKGTLTEVFKDRAYRDGSTRLIVPGLDGDSGAITVYDSAGSADQGAMPAADVALATLSVPTMETLAGNGAAAGGTFECAIANNPVDIALSRVLQTEAVVGEQVKVLSIGCRRYSGGNGSATAGSAHGVVRSQSDFALDTARALAGPSNVLRVEITEDGQADPSAEEGRWRALEVGQTEAGRLMPLLKATFLSKPIGRPVREDVPKPAKSAEIHQLFA
jgi:hypothetical protein